MSSIGYMYGEDVAGHMAFLEMKEEENMLEQIAALAVYVELHGAA